MSRGRECAMLGCHNLASIEIEGRVLVCYECFERAELRRHAEEDWR